jgi:hypothetical protein
MPQAPPSPYDVSLQGVAWQISHKGAVTGPFSSKEDALQVALKQAREASDAGDPSEVIVENEHREFESAWRAEGIEPADLQVLRSED